MRFTAKKGEKQVIVGTEGSYVILCHKYKNPTQAEIAARKLKNQYKKQNWDVKVIVKSLREESPVPPQGRGKKKRVVRLFGYKTILEE